MNHHTLDTPWDFRPLQDAHWSSAAVRAQHLPPVIAAYAAWASWPLARQQAVLERVRLRTVQHLIAALPGLPTPVREACEVVTTREEAARAARVAEAAAEAAYGAWDGEAAARASLVAQVASRAASPDPGGGVVATARDAARAARAARASMANAEAAARDAAGDGVLITMCAIFLAAIEEAAP